MSSQTTKGIDMSPMATYMALKDAAAAVLALRARLKDGESFGLAYRTASVSELDAFASQLRARANEFDTRSEPCRKCGFRHPHDELCGDVA